MKLIIKTPMELQAAREHTERAAARSAALDYLAATDWMVVRQAETGERVPEEVMKARRAARERASRHLRPEHQTT